MKPVGLVKGWGQADLIQRSRSDADGRGRVVRLTAAGRRLIDESFEEYRQRAPAAFDAEIEGGRPTGALLKSWLSRIELAM